MVKEYKKSPSRLLIQRVAISFLLSAVMLIGAGMGVAFASAPVSDVGASLCEVPRAVILGSVGRGIATIGIIVIGIMATLGRVTWVQAIIVGVGISVIFGAASLASTLSFGKGVDCLHGASGVVLNQ